MPDAPLILGISGLRGIVGESLTPEIAMRYAAAFGTWLRDSYDRTLDPHVIVARDGRLGGDSFARAAISGLQSTGCRVIDIGVAPTPTVGIMVDHIDQACAGLVVTASHNPQMWNGIKCILGRRVLPSEEAILAEACAPQAHTAEEITQRFSEGTIDWRTQFTTWPVESVSDACATHISYVGSETRFSCKPPDREFHCVVDSVNCSGARVASPFLSKHGCVTQLFGLDSGEFPHPPEPTKENLSGEGGLCDAVPGLKADIGFAQDPDADRLAIVDEKGNYIGEEYTLVLAAESLLQARSDGATKRRSDEAMASDDTPIICVNLSTSRMIDDVAQRHGARVVRTPVGEAHVVEMMKKLRADGHEVILGGEGNGGVIWPKVTYVRDSLSAMALTLALMARTGKSISELVAAMASYTIIKRKQPLASKGDAAPTLERIARQFADDPDAEVDTQDGVRIDWPARKAWVHVRASNTEPIMRLIGEAPLREVAEKILDQIERITPS